MTSRSAPQWLAEFQRRFGSVLRTPLDRSTGTLRAAMQSYDTWACAAALDGPALSAAERLSVYNRQYWFRLLRVMQQDYPLTSRLLGLWLWNEHAARYLSLHPPHHFDIHRVSEGVVAFLDATLTQQTVARGPRHEALPRRALLQAARIDAAYTRVFLAPEQAPLQLTAAQAAGLAGQRLRAARSWELVEEDWELSELRRSILGQSDEAAVALPAAWPNTSTSALVRTAAGVAQLTLHPLQARLLAALREQNVGTALALVEAACPAEERDTLPQRTQVWLAQSAELGLFCGIDGE